MFDPLTGKIKQKIPRFTVFPSSHYVTPRETVLRAIETIKIELRERLAALVADGKLVEAQRLEQRSEEHTSELQSLMRISYAVFCLQKKKHHTHIVAHLLSMSKQKY